MVKVAFLKLRFVSCCDLYNLYTLSNDAVCIRSHWGKNDDTNHDKKIQLLTNLSHTFSTQSHSTYSLLS